MNMVSDDYVGQVMPGDDCGPNFLTFEETPRKKLNQKIDPTGNRTRARCIRNNNVIPKPQRWSEPSRWISWSRCIKYTVLHGRLARCIKWRACGVGEAKEGFENELSRSRSEMPPPPLSGLLILNILYFTNSQEVRATRAPGAGTKMLGKETNPKSKETCYQELGPKVQPATHN